MRLLKIGRDASCNIVLHSDKVSSLHAEITLLNNGDIILEDKGSRNGTFIMNKQIAPGKPVNIRVGDAVRFADVELQWSQIPAPEDNSAYKAVYGVGSHFNNEFQISGSTVSRYHATIKVGRDGKIYIVDHSKNGTTVDGVKIPQNTPYRIKRKSAVVCGGVPVDLSTGAIPWPKDLWLYAVGAVAAVLVLVGIGFGAKKIIDGPGIGGGGTYEDGQLYAMYNNSVVYLEGIYHYRVTGVPEEKLAQFGLPENFYVDSKAGKIIPVESTAQLPSYSGTGFFISSDGKMLTNLHVVKPWLWDDNASVETLFKQLFASRLSINDYNTNGIYGAMTGDAAYISQLKIEGVLDALLFIPQGKYYSRENAVECRVLSAGDDVNKDVALIQSEKSEIPTGARFINVTDSMDMSDDALAVGKHIYTIGFPNPQSTLLQKPRSENGLQVIAQGGDIIQKDSEYEFGYNAPTDGGASGSPVFNNRGMLVGVHHAGHSRVSTQGYNYAIKAKYAKELIEGEHKVK